MFNPYMHQPPHEYHQTPRAPSSVPKENIVSSAPSSPLKIALPHPVSLDQFCEAYEIDDEDKAGLLKLKFHPGDQRVDRLEREDWHGHGGFSKLSWDDFLQKHKQFVRDIKGGKWAFPAF